MLATLTEQHLLPRCITEGLLSYGLGRHIESADGQFVDEICVQAERDDQRIGDLIFTIVNLRTGHGLKGCPALYTGGAAANLKCGEHIVLPQKDTPLALTQCRGKGRKQGSRVRFRDGNWP